MRFPYILHTVDSLIFLLIVKSALYLSFVCIYVLCTGIHVYFVEYNSLNI